MIAYRPAEAADVAWIGPRLRPADVAEVAASSGIPAARGLALSHAASSMAITAEADGEPAAMFGVVPGSALLGEAVIWMLATPAADRQARAWLREAPQWIALLGDGWRVLRNHVDVRNRASVRWLVRMGFRLEPAVPFGVEGRPFYPFWKEVGHV
ncbi:hypothetical protein M0638_26995 [Roseomonas sp. NAR14]|uniref:Uncharacterized protein n=1 Tax=Roseomonas acroporae TaxID=2937791 RepID=A0A9X2BWP1_9PROT|nr:hypothetical protein [Roseomonas acroporae]MCK8788008.1 hypothetical protein [Roseomonas acroporae]